MKKKLNKLLLLKRGDRCCESTAQKATPLYQRLCYCAMRLNSLLLTVSGVQLSVVVGGEEVSFGKVDTLCQFNLLSI